MSRPRKLFLAGAIIFLMALVYASYDISRRTTFPGSKPQLKERVMDKWAKKDSISSDSATNSP